MAHKTRLIKKIVNDIKQHLYYFPEDKIKIIEMLVGQQTKKFKKHPGDIGYIKNTVERAIMPKQVIGKPKVEDKDIYCSTKIQRSL